MGEGGEMLEKDGRCHVVSVKDSAEREGSEGPTCELVDPAGRLILELDLKDCVGEVDDVILRQG